METVCGYDQSFLFSFDDLSDAGGLQQIPHTTRYGEAWAAGLRLIYGHLASRFVVAFHLRTQLTDQLAHWLGHHPIFGIGDKIVQDLTESWCIAKIDRLIGPLGPPVKNPEYESEFRTAGVLSTGIHGDTDYGPVPYIDVSPLRRELESLPGPKVDPGLLDFIDSLLIVDHTKRPIAAEALKHPYLHSTEV